MQDLNPGMQGPSPDTTATDLVKVAIAEARQLIVLEVALAKDEVKREVMAAKTAGIGLGIGAATLLLGVAMLLVALGLAIFPGPVPALVIGLILMATAALAGLTGFKLLPKKPLAETRKRLEQDFETVKERVI
jgi:hypothetical protein